MTARSNQRLAGRASVVLPLLALLAIGAAPLGAQRPDAACSSVTSAALAACETAVDIFRLLAPEVGTAVTAGNATLGEAGTLGGLGHLTIEIRGNVVRGTVPVLSGTSFSGGSGAPVSIPTQTAPIPSAFVDGGIGLFRGLHAGLVHVLGIDALGSAFYAPTYTGNGILIRPGRALAFGYGGRVGVLDETRVSPAISVTFMQRNLPPTLIVGVDGNNDSLTVRHLSVNTAAWRAVIGKHLGLLGLAAGVGQDHETSDATLAVSGSILGVPLNLGTAAPHTSITRANYFADLSLDPPVVHFIVEVGGVSARPLGTYNSFSGARAGDALLYGSVGVRFKI